MAQDEKADDKGNLQSSRHLDSEIILRMSKQGMSIDSIASVWNVEPTEIVKTLERAGCCNAAEGPGKTTSARLGKSEAEQGFWPMVKRLMSDPEKFCCPLSNQLMEDPVVAGDGVTYERSWIEAYLKSKTTSPVTREEINTQVNPSQHMKSEILSFKESIVQEILSLAPKLPSLQASELLQRAEDFVRPAKDASAKRKLGSLLLLRARLPEAHAARTRVEIYAEVIALQGEIQQPGEMRRMLEGMEVTELKTLLPKLDKETICALHRVLPTEELADTTTAVLLAKEICCRMATDLGGDETLQHFWQLLLQRSSIDTGANMTEWREATAVVLTTFFERLKEVKVEELEGDLLSSAQAYMANKEKAIALAKEFFSYDLGISTLWDWPPKGTARILVEQAARLGYGEEAEKVGLLVAAYRIDSSDVALRSALKDELLRTFTSPEGIPDGSGGAGPIDLETLCLTMLLEDKEDVPPEVLSKLRFQENRLNQLPPSFLLDLAAMLGRVERQVDGAKVAMLGAKLLATKGDSGGSCDAALKAFCLDRGNEDAAGGLVEAVRSMKVEQESLKRKVESLESSIAKMPRTGDSAGTLSACSFVWDFSGCDFAGLAKGDRQESSKFNLPGGVTGFVVLLPKGRHDSEDGMAALFLHLDNPAKVDIQFKCGSVNGSLQRDYSSGPVNANGKQFLGRGWKDFIRTKELLQAGSVTVTLNSIQPEGSSIRFVRRG